MSLFGSIRMAANTLRANQIALQVIGQNIANANTPGYIREEVVLAPNPTVSGDATSLHITSLLEELGVKITRLARGLPTGGQIEYANQSILTDAITQRRKM